MNCCYDHSVFFVDCQLASELDASLSVWIVRSLFGGETYSGIDIDVVNVMRLSLGFDHPHGNLRIVQVCLVEMEDNFFPLVLLQNLLHVVLF